MRKYVWIIALCLVAAGAWFFFHSSSKSDGSASEAKSSGSGRRGSGRNMIAPVGVATAKAGDISVYLTGLGNITPRRTVTVHSLISGQLMKIFFTEGQMVKKNELLAKIDDRPYVAALEQAQGTLNRDQALLATAKLDLARYEELWKQDSIAKQQLDTQASLVKQYEGTVRNDEGLVDAAKTNLAYTRIISPVSGRAGLRQVDEGNIVHTTDTNGIVIVTELQPITALFTLPEDSMPAVFRRMSAGGKLQAQAWNRDNKTKLADGMLTAADNQVDPTTGTVRLRAEFANEDGSLFPSQFVNIRLKLETLDNVVTVPSAAIQRGTQGNFVYLIKPDRTVVVQPVTLGPSEGDVISVEKGVSVGDQLVVDGTDRLREGEKVEIAAIDGKPVEKEEGTGKGKENGDGKEASAKPHRKHKKHPDDGE